MPFFFFSEIDWQLTPKAVLIYILYMHSQLEALKRQVELLEARLDANSGNSNKPPSSDSPYKRQPKKKSKGKPGAKKGHQGHRQVMLEPTEAVVVKPKQCPCSNTYFPETRAYHTHPRVAYFKIHPRRSKEALTALIDDRQGIWSATALRSISNGSSSDKLAWLI